MKDEEVDELRGIRERLMKEVSDFTASLFEVSCHRLLYLEIMSCPDNQIKTLGQCFQC